MIQNNIVLWIAKAIIRHNQLKLRRHMQNQTGKSPSNVFKLFPDTEDKAQDEHAIIGHFYDYFEPILALNDDWKQECFSLRHQIYCEELGFEKACKECMECDNYDGYAHSCLIQHFPTMATAGTIRVIAPRKADDVLPMEHYYKKRGISLDIEPSSFAREEIAEISRIAISELFRRREIDRHKCSATGAINRATYSEIEQRCFPLIAVGLYLSSAAICRVLGVQHAFAMMEPELERSVKFVGVACEQIGDPIEYHGIRTPYYINPNSLSGLSPAFFALINSIEKTYRDNLAQVNES